MFVFNCTDIFKTDHSIGFRHNFGLCVFGCRSTADVECSHGQLRSRLTDRLCGDNAERIADLSKLVCRKVASIAFDTDTMFDFTSQDGTDQNTRDIAFFDQCRKFRCEFLSCLDQQTTVIINRVADILCAETSDQTLFKRKCDFIAFDNRTEPDSFERSAVFGTADDILRHIDQLTGHVTGVSGLQSGIGKSFTGTVRTDEVFQNRQTFTEVGEDRTLDDVARRFRHQSAHTGKLTDLILAASRS